MSQQIPAWQLTSKDSKYIHRWELKWIENIQKSIKEWFTADNSSRILTIYKAIIISTLEGPVPAAKMSICQVGYIPPGPAAAGGFSAGLQRLLVMLYVKSVKIPWLDHAGPPSHTCPNETKHRCGKGALDRARNSKSKMILQLETRCIFAFYWIPRWSLDIIIITIITIIIDVYGQCLAWSSRI